jgi:hypothetical protein
MVAVEETRGQESVVARVPGIQTAPEQRRLGKQAGEIEKPQGIDAGDAPYDRGQASGQLDRRSERRHEQDERL